MDKTKEELFYEGTIHMVAEIGIENLRTKQIADYAGFSEATLFRSFETKEDILCSTFLYVDKKLSDFLTKSAFINKHNNKDDKDTFDLGTYNIWRKVYRHLIDNKEETIFLIRYRYSSLYTKAVRGQREAYNGSFNKAYEAFEKRYGSVVHSYRGFLINYMFEMTLCFAEKIITGKVEDSEETEYRIWTAVSTAAKIITSREVEKNDR